MLWGKKEHVNDNQYHKLTSRNFSNFILLISEQYFNALKDKMKIFYFMKPFHKSNVTYKNNTWSQNSTGFRKCFT